MNLQTGAEIVSNVATAGAAIAAAWWFVYTAAFHPRIQFDIECRPTGSAIAGRLIVELSFVFENKGFVEHRLYDLKYSLHTIADAVVSQDDGQVRFPTRLQGLTSLVPSEIGYFFVRPNVVQSITHIVAVSDGITHLRVTAGFSYRKDARWPHTARRVFSLPTAGTAPGPST
jgi:hypothetical protein